MSNLFDAIEWNVTKVALALIHKGATLSVRVYNKAIQTLDYAKALVQRFDLDKGFPSLGTLCVFNLPLALHNSERHKHLVRNYGPNMDIEFLKKHRDDLHPLSFEIQKALSMFKR